MKDTRERAWRALALSTKIIFTVLSTSAWQMAVINQQPESVLSVFKWVVRNTGGQLSWVFWKEEIQTCTHTNMHVSTAYRSCYRGRLHGAGQNLRREKVKTKTQEFRQRDKWEVNRHKGSVRGPVVGPLSRWGGRERRPEEAFVWMNASHPPVLSWWWVINHNPDKIHSDQGSHTWQQSTTHTPWTRTCKHHNSICLFVP